MIFNYTQHRQVSIFAVIWGMFDYRQKLKTMPETLFEKKWNNLIIARRQKRKKQYITSIRIILKKKFAKKQLELKYYETFIIYLINSTKMLFELSEV